MTVLTHTRREFATARAKLDGPVALVPTMGALHDGHVALVDAAHEFAQFVVMTIFVNPMQFGANEDLAKYPRTLEADLSRATAAGVDLVWAPSVDDVYVGGPARVAVDPGPLAAELEGAFRPTHFAGVLTVVAKLFGVTRPDAAFFGEKDYQQLALIRQMSADLDLGVDVRGVPTVREPDGLALSSRNVYLSPDERRQALVLSRALRAGADAAADGPDAVVAAGRAVLATEPDVAVDYFELRDAVTLGPVSGDTRPGDQKRGARLLVAARVGRTRLIDNLAVRL